MPTQPKAPAREALITALEADLVGPFQVEDPMSTELLSVPPSRWYLTGFLAPQLGREDEEDPETDDELGAGSDDDSEESAGQEPEPKRKNLFPASIGLSVLIPTPQTGEHITVTVRYADYVQEEREPEPKGKRRAKIREWKRIPRSPITVLLPLDVDVLAKGLPVSGADGLTLIGKLERVDAETFALAVFLVNRRPQGEKGRKDEQFIFQVSLELRFERGFIPRVNVQGERSNEWDERVGDLQFRARYEHAVGHGVSVFVPEQGGPVRVVRTAWIPRGEVPRVVTHDEPGVEVRMSALAELPDGTAAKAALSPLVEAYGSWIAAQRHISIDSQSRQETRDELMQKAELAKKRMAAGIEVLVTHPHAFEAFRLANVSMAMAATQRTGEPEPRWRLFQIAFLLLNLSALADDTHADREVVDLIFFPTGGGKTEAYLGVIAFALVLRRIEGQSRPDLGLGVAVLLRYTLRLLTLDQLGRAATLICALEEIRKTRVELLGEVRFSVGIWVGRSATANTLAQVQERITKYKNNPSDGASSPFPLTDCPWCKTPLTRDSFVTQKGGRKLERVIVGCMNHRCSFSAAKNPEGVPVVFVDEQIYRELPCFLVATVDKFAMLPWRGETGMLFGRAKARRGKELFGPLDVLKKDMEPLPNGLRPPELIVQDELHLISGPLGTMVGLYETAIEALCVRESPDGKKILPKLIASTATVRRAAHQIQAVFGRRQTALFPPPGVNDSETYFAKIDRQSPGRIYIGVAAQGRAMKAILLRVYVSLLASGARSEDAYTTLVGYFNSLRELGGMRRLVDDEVRKRCAQIEQRKPLDFTEPHPRVVNRGALREPVELTSREPIHRIKDAKARLGVAWGEVGHVDVLLASNMISVGVDIDRLGLMVVAGQPKTSSEYIQASSRVGRDAKRPGLVVTCFNLHKPRDRSHYERFAAYHESFYRFVEATSATPFSGPALERGFAGTLVAMTRLLDAALTRPEAAMNLAEHRAVGSRAALALAARALQQPDLDAKTSEAQAAAIKGRAENLLDAWIRLAEEAKAGAGEQKYSKYDRDKADNPLLRDRLDRRIAEEDPDGDRAKFVAPTSMRDVEPAVHLWLQRTALGGKGK